ncbi:hypothetical protein DPMN_083743 [Dreissena polymorpha]|uniref:Uncharacterized protein n=1 Tax=Dreissena polymorpha TaxID=45954 RepID=A0A9D4BK59_DREPO|nr:hypothetical protein DPMN_083743 [Dreissena polymorpha]
MAIIESVSWDEPVLGVYGGDNENAPRVESKPTMSRCCFCFLSSAPELSPIWPSPPERRVSWLLRIVQDTGDILFQR